jgi:hypothetical protein
MVETLSTPITVVGESPASAWLADSPVANASIARYLAAGDSMRSITAIGLWVCVALFVIVAAAWLLGVLPMAVRFL